MTSFVGRCRNPSPFVAAFLPSCQASRCFSDRGAGNREIRYTAEARLVEYQPSDLIVYTQITHRYNSEAFSWFASFSAFSASAISSSAFGKKVWAYSSQSYGSLKSF